jgi:hypothetical protein
LEIEPAKQDKGSQMRAAAIMRRLGWHKDKQWHMGSWQRGWAAPDRSTDPPHQKVDREVDRYQNPNEINTSSNTDPPDPPFDQHFPKNIAAHASSLVVARETSGKSLEKGGSVAEVDRCQDDGKSILTATDSPCDPPQEPDSTSYQSEVQIVDSADIKTEKVVSSEVISDLAAADDPLRGWEQRNDKKPFPNRKSDNIQSDRKRSLGIGEGFVAARCINDLAKLKAENGGDFSHAEIKWVVNWLKQSQPIVYRHYEECLKVSQPGLL